MKNTSRFPWRRFHGVCSILIILYPGVSVTSPVPEAAMTCNEGEFLCIGDKTCISAEWVCDNSPDCFDVSDEKDCEKEGAGAGAEPPPPPCEDNQFRCHSDRVCIDAAWVCDGGIDCNDKSDELNCTEAVICTDNEFRCKMTGHCIQTEYICDGTSDCIDNSDEDGCPEQTPANPTTAVSQSTTTPDLDFLDLEKLNINPQKFSAVDFDFGEHFSLPENFAYHDTSLKINPEKFSAAEFDFGENFALPENFTYHDTSSDSEIPVKPLLITINSTDIILVNNVTLTNETTEITPVPDNFTRDHVTESIAITDEFDSNSELGTDISFNLSDNPSSLFINETDDDRSFLEEFFETSTQDLSTTQTSDFVTISETSTMTSFGTFTETPITETPITDTTITDSTITDSTIETIATTSPILDTTESTFPSTDTSLITTTIPTTTTTIPTTTTTTTTTTPTTTTQSTTTTTTTTTPSTTTTRRTTTPYPCAYNQFYCRADLNCIPVEWRCDHTEDCWDGSDEIHCDQVSVYCPYEDMINCQDTGQCIYLAWICDGHNDCDTGSDEFNCPSKD